MKGTTRKQRASSSCKDRTDQKHVGTISVLNLACPSPMPARYKAPVRNVQPAPFSLESGRMSHLPSFTLSFRAENEGLRRKCPSASTGRTGPKGRRSPRNFLYPRTCSSSGGAVRGFRQTESGHQVKVHATFAGNTGDAFQSGADKAPKCDRTAPMQKDTETPRYAPGPNHQASFSSPTTCVKTWRHVNGETCKKRNWVRNNRAGACSFVRYVI